jgi:Gpi18-like mannosyltransferase
MQKRGKVFQRDRWLFPLLMGLTSRGLIVLAMVVIAPLLAVPEGARSVPQGWDVFFAWDSAAYHAIAVEGYNYINDGQGYNVAFFPLLPLLTKLVMALGLPFAAAATLVNNFAFLGALFIFYNWLDSYQGKSVARWSTAVLAWCPFSLFGTVIYTEGLFLLCSTAALAAFDRQRHFLAAFWGILATATRITGLALVPAFLVTAWRKKRPFSAYLAGFLASGGLILYSLYCWLQFNEPLAFLKVQKAWQPEQDFFGQGWLIMFGQILFSHANVKAGELIDPWHPLIIFVVGVLSVLLWKFRDRIPSIGVDLGFGCLFLVLWLIAGDPFINTIMVLGGVYLLWHTRKKIPAIALFYAFFSFCIIFSSGRTTSAERYVYGIVSTSIALGIILQRYPRWGYAVMMFFAVLLFLFGLRFAQHQWVA